MPFWHWHWFVLPLEGEEDSIAGLLLGLLPCLTTPDDAQGRHDEASVV